MKKILFYSFLSCVFFASISYINAQTTTTSTKVKKVLYFNPEVEPDIEEIKEPTNLSFFSAVTDNVSSLKKIKIIRSEAYMPFNNINEEDIIEYAKNNDADFVIVPKIKYFKVGIGKYVFSNQVIVSLKLFDKEGNFITHSEYDTYKKNMRLLGSTENSIKIGTNGAIKTIIKKLKKLKPITEDNF